MNNMTALDYAKMGAAAIMNKFTAETLPPTGRFHYHQGVFLAGVERIYQLTGDEKYRTYIKNWVDLNIDENGASESCHLTEFDDIQPGILLFDLYRTTGDERYKKMLDRMNDVLEKWPTNAKGGVWHKYHNKNQMWLDTMYMMGVISAMYAKEFDNPYMFEKIHKQMMLMREYMTNPETGLLYHMWDDSKVVPMVDRKNGLIKQHWGRAIGWYVVAIAEILEYFPKEHHLRQDFIGIEVEVLNSLVKYQDEESGLWYQLVDKTKDPRNWKETSCSALFTYAMAKSLRLGIIDASFKENIIKGYRGVLSKVKLCDDIVGLTDICIGTGFGTEQFYFDRPTVENDLHGMGAFLLMCTEVYKIIEDI